MNYLDPHYRQSATTYRLQLARAEIRDLKSRLAIAEKASQIEKMSPQEFDQYCNKEVSSAIWMEQTIKKLQFRGKI